MQVSAHARPGVRPGRAGTDLTQNRFTALRQFEIWSCNALFADCSTDAGYNRVYASAANAFPSDAPRPVAPTLILREFTFSPIQATHLRLVVQQSQCTGGPAFQGEQDADPHNATDCNDGRARVDAVRPRGRAAGVRPGLAGAGQRRLSDRTAGAGRTSAKDWNDARLPRRPTATASMPCRLQAPNVTANGPSRGADALGARRPPTGVTVTRTRSRALEAAARDSSGSASGISAPSALRLRGPAAAAGGQRERAAIATGAARMHASIVDPAHRPAAPA